MKATVTTILIAALAVTVLALSVALVSERRSRADFRIPEITMRTDTVLICDTVLIDRPVEAGAKTIDTILISTVLPVPGDTVRLTDTVYVHLPVEQTSRRAEALQRTGIRRMGKRLPPEPRQPQNPHPIRPDNQHHPDPGTSKAQTMGHRHPSRLRNDSGTKTGVSPIHRNRHLLQHIDFLITFAPDGLP